MFGLPADIESRLHVLRPYMIENQRGFFSNYVLTGPSGESINVESVALYYSDPIGDSVTATYCVIDFVSPSDTGRSYRDQILGFEIRPDTMAEEHTQIRQWQSPGFRMGALMVLEANAEAQRLPLVFILFGTSCESRQEMAVLYCLPGMPAKVALDIIQQACRDAAAANQ